MLLEYNKIPIVTMSVLQQVIERLDILERRITQLSGLGVVAGPASTIIKDEEPVIIATAGPARVSSDQPPKRRPVRRVCIRRN